MCYMLAPHFFEFFIFFKIIYVMWHAIMVTRIKSLSESQFISCICYFDSISVPFFFFNF